MDKYEVYERQSEAVGSSGDELEELLTPDEKKRAESVRRSLNKCVAAGLSNLHVFSLPSVHYTRTVYSLITIRDISIN